MSKLSPLGQSMASLFTPESDKLRASQKKGGDGARGAAGTPLKIPGTKAITSHKSGDSLGNPNSPGYEPWGKKKQATAGGTEEDETSAPGPGGKVIETSQQGPEFVRLSAGWEILLLAQKKLCEKAKGIFTLLEGPVKYTSQKKNTTLQSKSRGCILDLDVQKTQEELAWKLKEAKDKEKESA
jgi:hypothetical protein